MKKILFTWIGDTDLRAMGAPEKVGSGPILQAAKNIAWDEVVLLCDYHKNQGDSFRRWLGNSCSVGKITICCVTLSGPTNFDEIYRTADKVLTKKKLELGSFANFTYHVSPGTPAMAAVWILLSKTKHPAKLIESSREHGVKTVVIPFDISADFIPSQAQTTDDKITRLAAGLPSPSPAFSDIVYRSDAMRRVIVKARLVAVRSIPVLIEGESGTGKELLARAIHFDSLRANKAFVTINCGAIPEELVESELFGHEKGAFTGAIKQRLGHFEAANGGTLFLDEIGELPVSMQVKLLRVLQEREVKPVGATKPRKIDVRIIAATNKNLLHEVANGTFREDLFYRLAVAVLKLPPLRERTGDLSLLIDTFMQKINQENEPGTQSQHKRLSPSAKNLLLQHPFPGNIRELVNTLTRASVWTGGSTIQAVDIEESLLPGAVMYNHDSILNMPLEHGVDLPSVIEKIVVHYLNEAMKITNNNKTKAAELLGLSSYQTLTNWLRKYRVN